MNMMKSAACCLYGDHELIASVCEVEPSLPAPIPSAYFGMVITPTLEPPTWVTNLRTSVPAVTVIALLPSTQVCCAWYRSSEPMSSFQHLELIIWPSRVHHSARSGSVNFFEPTTACLSSSTDVSDSEPRSENSHPPNQPSFTPPAIGVMPFERSVEQSERNSFQVVGGPEMPARARTSLR